jgi:hypothetical protein
LWHVLQHYSQKQLSNCCQKICWRIKRNVISFFVISFQHDVNIRIFLSSFCTSGDLLVLVVKDISDVDKVVEVKQASRGDDVLMHLLGSSQFVLLYGKCVSCSEEITIQAYLEGKLQQTHILPATWGHLKDKYW